VRYGSVLISGCALLGGCMSSHNQTVMPTLITTKPPEDPLEERIRLGAMIKGRLSVEGKCIVLKKNGQLTSLIFPSGTIIVGRNGKGFTITKSSRKLRISSESLVSLAGGFVEDVTTMDLTTAPPNECPKTFFVVSEN
jgi:hypothetical protein